MLDSAEAPTEVEFHFSPRSLQDPASHVRFLDFDLEIIRRSPVRSYDLLYFHPGRSTDPIDEIPWLVSEDPPAFLGYAVYADDASSYTANEGEPLFDHLEDISMIHLSEFAPRRKSANVGGSNPGGRCVQNYNESRCAAHLQIYGLSTPPFEIEYKGDVSKQPYMTMMPVRNEDAIIRYEIYSTNIEVYDEIFSLDKETPSRRFLDSWLIYSRGTDELISFSVRRLSARSMNKYIGS